MRFSPEAKYGNNAVSILYGPSLHRFNSTTTSTAATAQQKFQRVYVLTNKYFFAHFSAVFNFSYLENRGWIEPVHLWNLLRHSSLACRMLTYTLMPELVRVSLRRLRGKINQSQ